MTTRNCYNLSAMITGCHVSDGARGAAQSQKLRVGICTPAAATWFVISHVAGRTASLLAKLSCKSFNFTSCGQVFASPPCRDTLQCRSLNNQASTYWLRGYQILSVAVLLACARMVPAFWTLSFVKHLPRGIASFTINQATFKALCMHRAAYQQCCVVHD